jgi:hypothetical protein
LCRREYENGQGDKAADQFCKIERRALFRHVD